MDFQRIGGTGQHTAGAAHAILQCGYPAGLLALLPHRNAHVTHLFATLAVDAFVRLHVDAVEASMIEQPEGGTKGYIFWIKLYTVVLLV